MTEPQFVPDERLRLYYLCAHPAIDPAAQVPLLLQLVLGLTAEEIARLYVVPAPQMSQRLVRSKTKIRDAGIAPSLPAPDEVKDRTDVVLDALYAAYVHAWELPGDSVRSGLAEECIQLLSTLDELVPNTAEVKGLLAMLLLSEARRPARRDDRGAFVPLEDQDPQRWDRAKIRFGLDALMQASALRHPGRYQLEAAIQAAHLQRVESGEPSWSAILRLYDALLQIAPSLSAHLGRITALARAEGAEVAFADLEARNWPDHYQPYWAVRSDLLRSLGRTAEADQASTRAAELATDASVRDYLKRVGPSPE